MTDSEIIIFANKLLPHINGCKRHPFSNKSILRSAVKFTMAEVIIMRKANNESEFSNEIDSLKKNKIMKNILTRFFERNFTNRLICRSCKYIVRTLQGKKVNYYCSKKSITLAS